MRALAVALTILAATLCACGESDPGPRPTPPAAQPPERAARPLPPEEAVPATAPDGRAAAPEPPAPGFWATIEDARLESGGDVEDEFELIWERLRQRGAGAMRAFAEEVHRRDAALYTWDLWGAAAVADDGCSDDCFADFRIYVISLGREAFEAARHDPNALAALMPDDADWSDAGDSMIESYEALAGQEPPGAEGPDGEPRGTAWDSDEVERLRGRFHELDERFG